MSEGFYLTHPRAYPSLADLRRFWEDAVNSAGLSDPDPWERTGDVIEHVARAGDLEVEPAIFLDADDPCEVSIEGHWSTPSIPARYARGQRGRIAKPPVDQGIVLQGAG